MQLPTPPPQVARAGLAALTTFARADGEVRPLQWGLIEAIQEHILRSDVDLGALDVVEPEAVAREVQDPAFRQRILYGCMLLGLVDGELGPADVATLERWAGVLGVEDRTLRTLRHYAEGHTRRLWWDVARRFIGGVRLEHDLARSGASGLLDFVRDLARRGVDGKRVARYAPLADLPRGTLGREYVEFLRANDFGLPGEKGAAPELVVFHDCCHVLTGYDTSYPGEAQISGFHAGTHGEDPFGMLLFCVMQEHLGVQISPGAPAQRGFFDPDPVLRAFARGMKVKGDMMLDWDPHPHFERPVDELRVELGIPPA